VHGEKKKKNSRGMAKLTAKKKGGEPRLLSVGRKKKEMWGHKEFKGTPGKAQKKEHCKMGVGGGAPRRRKQRKSSTTTNGG